MQRAGVAYRRLLDYQKERGYANDTQLGVGKDGNQRTLYSLRHTAYGIRHTAYGIRHTAIIYRLLFGGDINLLSLARNARKSVTMIERFYASQLEDNLVTNELHQRRG
jgi:hypothetical protein